MDAAEKHKMTKYITRAFAHRNFDEITIDYPEVDITGGYAAELKFARVVGEKAKKKTTFEIILKCGRGDSSLVKLLNVDLSYTHEINFYSKILPLLTNLEKEKHLPLYDNIPLCYGTIMEDNDFIIMLDNLKVKGFKLHGMEKSQDIDHVNLVIEAYAKWHALSFALKENCPEEFENLKQYVPQPEGCKMYQMTVETIINEMGFAIDMYKEKNKPQVENKLKTLRKNLETLYRDCLNYKDDPYVVVRHGDCWNNNFLFHYDESNKPDKVAILDWQLGCIGPPIADVTQYLFYVCIRAELEKFEELLEFYYETLSKKLKQLGCDPEKCFPWKTCRKSFDTYAPLAIAGMTMCLKMRYVDTDVKLDLEQVEKEGNMNVISGGALSDPDQFFETLDDILDFCIQRGFI